MNRIPLKRSLLSLCIMASIGNAYADDTTASDELTALNTITAYIQNLGMYFGYDVTGYCTTGGSCGGSSSSASSSSSSSGSSGSFSNQLTPLTTTNIVDDAGLFSSFLGAILPNVNQQSAQNTTTFQLIPTTYSALASYATWVNSMGNHAISTKNAPYSSPSSTLPSVSTLVDQGQGSSTSSNYQFDPVNQAILNLLSTPDVSYCTDQSNDSNQGGLVTNCTLGGTSSSGEPVLSQVQVMMNTIGSAFTSTSAAAPMQFLSPTQNATLVSQLNSDSLLGPLMFDNTGSNSNTPSQNTAAGQGLAATDQVQQANNFIRYVTGSVTPPTQPNQSAYTSLYATAMGQTPGTTPATQLNAQSIIASYIANMRVYAAQASVGISNMYYLLSKRMPQQPANATSSNPITSQALSEFNMATWRLAPAQTSGAQTWVTQINSASSATVEKEIAILLAEINYQLYLNRTMQERQLLTESTLLLQAARNAPPRSDLSESPAAQISQPMSPQGNS